jgi:hypothetical protein
VSTCSKTPPPPPPPPPPGTPPPPPPPATPPPSPTPQTPVEHVNEPPDTPVEGDGAAPLPYTGPGDVFAALVLALLASTGGAVLFLHAATREAFVGGAKRTMRSITGFSIAHNDLERADERQDRRSR